jgi:hypothetical protein
MPLIGGGSRLRYHETVIIDSKTQEPSSNEGGAGVGLVRQDETGCESFIQVTASFRRLP